MFSEKNINLPIFTEKLKTNFENDGFFSDKKLLNKGILKETIEEIEEDEGIICITKEFVANDGSYIRKDTITMTKSDFEKIKASSMSNEEIEKQIQDYKDEMEKLSNKQEYEKCSELRDKIQTLTKLIAV